MNNKLDSQVYESSVDTNVRNVTDISQDKKRFNFVCA